MKKQVRLSVSDAMIVKFHLEQELNRLNILVHGGDAACVGLLTDRIFKLQSILSKLS